MVPIALTVVEVPNSEEGEAPASDEGRDVSIAFSVVETGVVTAGTPVGIVVAVAGGAEVAATSEVGYTSVASVAVTINVTCGIVSVCVAVDVLTVTTVPDAEPVVTVVGSQGTTVVIVWMIVTFGTSGDGVGSVMVDGIAVTMAGFSSTYGAQRPRKYSTALVTSSSSDDHASRQPTTLLTNSSWGQ